MVDHRGAGAVDRPLRAITGGYGYAWIQRRRAFLDARVQTIYGGTTKSCEIIGRNLGV